MEKKNRIKAMNITQLADRAGVSRATLSRWVGRIKPELESMGYDEGMRVLPPSVVKYIARHYDIEMD